MKHEGITLAGRVSSRSQGHSQPAITHISHPSRYNSRHFSSTDETYCQIFLEELEARAETCNVSGPWLSIRNFSPGVIGIWWGVAVPTDWGSIFWVQLLSTIKIFPWYDTLTQEIGKLNEPLQENEKS